MGNSEGVSLARKKQHFAKFLAPFSAVAFSLIAFWALLGDCRPTIFRNLLRNTQRDGRA